MIDLGATHVSQEATGAALLVVASVLAVLVYYLVRSHVLDKGWRRLLPATMALWLAGAFATLAVVVGFLGVVVAASPRPVGLFWTVLVLAMGACFLGVLAEFAGEERDDDG